MHPSSPHGDPLPGYLLMHVCRETIDGGGASLALEAVRVRPLETPVGRAGPATIEATAPDDEVYGDNLALKSGWAEYTVAAV